MFQGKSCENFISKLDKRHHSTKQIKQRPVNNKPDSFFPESSRKEAEVVPREAKIKKENRMVEEIKARESKSRGTLIIQPVQYLRGRAR